jgi:hypothetical protein
MHFGNLIARLENEPDATQMIEALGNLVLYAEASAAAGRYGETPGEYLAASVGQFAAHAGDEEWLGLIAKMERADDPSRAAISYILRWALAHDPADTMVSSTGCSCAT